MPTVVSRLETSEDRSTKLGPKSRILQHAMDGLIGISSLAARHFLSMTFVSVSVPIWQKAFKFKKTKPNKSLIVFKPSKDKILIVEQVLVEFIKQTELLL